MNKFCSEKTADSLFKAAILFLVCAFMTSFVAAQKSNDLEKNLTSPSPNGKIAYFSFGQIFTMNADGSDKINLTNDSNFSFSPQWSPDGTKIVFTRGSGENTGTYVMNADGSNLLRVTERIYPEFDWSPDGTKFVYEWEFEIYTVNVDGTNTVRITTNNLYEGMPEFSPDGSKIVYLCSRPNEGGQPPLTDDICLINTDGTNEINLTHSPASDSSPAFSPDGTKIAYTSNVGIPGGSSPSEIVVINSNGTNKTVLTNNNVGDGQPAWSPDGTKIVFASELDGFGYSEIYVMDSDGNNRTRLTNNQVDDFSPSWQRVASAASIGGRVTTTGGRAIGNARIVLTDARGTLRTALSNAFGYFTLENVPTGFEYAFAVSSKRYVFNQNSQVRIIVADTGNINFVAND